jgi:hypothetical protein
MEKLFRNQKLNVSVRTVRCGDEILFYAKDVAKSLRYADTKRAVRAHVWKEDKYTLGCLKRGELIHPLPNGHPSTVLITEQGLYQLIFGSELNTAKEFRSWVFKDVLHHADVSYIRDNHPEAVIIPGLGECQDTASKRCDAWKKGYKGGQPDLIIENPMGKYKGFAIEFKSPKGTGITSEKQEVWLEKLRGIGYATMISDDILKACIRINEYFGKAYVA